ncbi:Ribosomal protein S18 acetylase RimI [Chryseolinea serpens]|uniref:Ribosomal protein S18 acetylase RimI n=1 Tax=Chryseolinea serpens TaxID=947013 RepID=A0A1M5M127_9BACT|nr:GNAT family N-acetyltransferase [Chryseolinea serpens]SHG71007.1 Ribosomal protein S18 acetylase RimI [Chryseolinea serpens]
MKFRKATRQDVLSIIQLLANDALGQARERYADPLPETYYNAFERIHADPNQELIVVEDSSNEIIGTLQLSFIPYLTYQGGIRAQIEAVRIREGRRGDGLGQKMFEWAIERARERNAHLLQLTTDKQRPDAIRFYEKLGFKASHEGMKLNLAIVDSYTTGK